MKYIRFFQEFNDEKKRTVPSGNVVAVSTNLRGFPEYHRGTDEWNVDAIGAVGFEPNSAVASTNVSREWLRENTKRISEAKAREIHPNLFKYLDSNN